MEVKANLKQLRISPRKVRLVVDMIRGLTTDQALAQLKYCRKWAAKPIAKLVNSAMANAEHNYELEKSNLFIKEIKVSEGQKLKRWMPKAYGRATPVRKRSSHIDIVLAEVKDTGVKQAKKREIEEPIKLDALLEKSDQKVEKIKEDKKPKSKDAKDEKGKTAVDPRMGGRRGHGKIEGGAAEGKGFIDKMFRRKSG